LERKREIFVFPHKSDAMAEAGSKATLSIDVLVCCMMRPRARTQKAHYRISDNEIIFLF
jgi:hypothetical protein